jgi:[amino group carrier protein]-lysine/ornithine hydrolase
VARDDAVPDAEALQLLADLVAIPSPSGAEQAASAHLVGWMREHGCDARVDEAGNAVAIRGTGDREILLLGHIDTFPGEVPVRRDGDLLYGRGSVDAKGPLCAFAAAAAGTAVPAGWRVTVVGAVEEEAATSKGARHILERRQAGSRGRPPAYCIIGEPSRWDRVTLGYRGRLVFDIALRAPFAHSAGAERLPAERGVAAWSAIEQYCARWNTAQATAGSVFDQLSASLRAFVTADEGAFGAARLSVGVRIPLNASPDRVRDEIVRDLAIAVGGGARNGADARRDAAAGSAADGDVTLDVRVLGGEPAYRGGKSNPLVRALLGEIRAAGAAPRFVVKTGTADMNVVGPVWPATPIVAYGPGDSSLDHTPREHIDLGEFLRSVAVLRGVLRRLFETA